MSTEIGKLILPNGGSFTVTAYVGPLGPGGDPKSDRSRVQFTLHQGEGRITAYGNTDRDGVAALVGYLETWLLERGGPSSLERRDVLRGSAWNHASRLLELVSHELEYKDADGKQPLALDVWRSNLEEMEKHVRGLLGVLEPPVVVTKTHAGAAIDGPSPLALVDRRTPGTPELMNGEITGRELTLEQWEAQHEGLEGAPFPPFPALQPGERVGNPYVTEEALGKAAEYLAEALESVSLLEESSVIVFGRPANLLEGIDNAIRKAVAVLDIPQPPAPASDRLERHDVATELEDYGRVGEELRAAARRKIAPPLPRRDVPIVTVGVIGDCVRAVRGRREELVHYVRSRDVISDDRLEELATLFVAVKSRLDDILREAANQSRG